MHYAHHKHSQEDKIVKLNVLGDPKRHSWESQQFGSFCINIEGLEKEKVLFPS